MALSTSLTVALRLPVAVALKVTLMVHDRLIPRVAGQLLVCAKSAAFTPEIVMLPMFSVAVPLLVRVIFCAALVMPTTPPLNERLLVLKVTSGMPTIKLFRMLAVVF